MPKYSENLIHFCNPVLEHYELEDEIPRMFVRSMFRESDLPLVLSLLAGIDEAGALEAAATVRDVVVGEDAAAWIARSQFYERVGSRR